MLYNNLKTPMSTRFLSLPLGCVLALPMNADAQEFRDRSDSLFFAQNHEHDLFPVARLACGLTK